MTKQKNTKRALLLSALSLLLCVSMLIGSTFAWFTEIIESGKNRIVAGNLDVELYYSTDAKTWDKVTSGTNVFKEGTLWEPGHTEVVYLKVANEGSLALKYNLGINIFSETPGINVADEVFKLSDYIMYDVLPFTAAYADRDAARAAAAAGATKLNTAYANDSQLLDTGDSEMVALVVYMPETVGNEANYKTGTTAPEINLGISLFATQFTEEKDSYGDDYDAKAYMSVSNAAELRAAINNAAANTAIFLEPGEYLIDSVIVVDKGQTVTLYGNNDVVLKNTGSSHLFNVTNESNVTFKNLVLDGNIAANARSRNGVYVRGNATVTLINTTIKNTGHFDLCIDQVSDGDYALGKSATVSLYNSSVEDVNADAAPVADTVATAENSSYVKFFYDGNSTVGSIRKNSAYTASNVFINGDNGATGTMVADGVWLTAPKTYAVRSEAGLKNLEAVLTAAKPNEGNILNVELMCDVDLSGDKWDTIDCMWIVFNGNGHTISNINCGKDNYVGRSGFWGYAGAVTINNLTLENVTSCGTQAGTFAGSADGLKLNNCFLKGTNVVTWEQNAADAPYQETASGIGAITGVTINSNLNVEIASGATVTLNLNGITTILNKVDNLVGHEVPGYAVNSGNTVNKGKIIVTASSAADLQFALDTATAGENYIVLAADITGDVIAAQKAGVNITFDGADHKYDGTIKVDGNARAAGTETLTIKKINFVSNVTRDFITANKVWLNNGNNYNYAHNVTVEDCTFTGAEGIDVVATRFRQSYNIVVKNCTGTNLHSVMWATGGQNITVDNVTATCTSGGVSVGTTTPAVIKNCNFTVTDDYGYGIRMDASGAYTLTVENNTIKADAPVLVRKASGATVVTLNGNTLTSDEGYQVLATGSDYEEGKTLTAPSDKVTIIIDGMRIVETPVEIPVAPLEEDFLFPAGTNAVIYENMVMSGDAQITHSANAVLGLSNVKADLDHDVIIRQSSGAIVIENSEFTLTDGAKLISVDEGGDGYQVFLINVKVNGVLLTQENAAQYMDGVTSFSAVSEWPNVA